MNRHLLFHLLFLSTVGISYAEPSLAHLIREKETMNLRQKEIAPLIDEGFKKIMPKGKQSYGTFEWTCSSKGSVISLKAKDENNKQHIWAQVFYYPNLTDDDRRKFSKECVGYPAKRYENKWAWVLVGKTEIRMVLSDKALESDKIIDSIVKSFDLDAISKF